jgi:hypothetical protein
MMKVTLESTDIVLSFARGDRQIPARVWRGTTADGVPVAAFIVSISPQTHDASAHAQFEAELRDITGDSRIERTQFDARFVL